MRKLFLLPALILALLFTAAFRNAPPNSRLQQDGFTPPSQPDIILSSGDASMTGEITVACWPRGIENITCTTSEAAFTGLLLVDSGEPVTIEFTEQEEIGLPDQFRVSSPDNPNFSPIQGDPAEINAFLPDNSLEAYQVEVTAYYTFDDLNATITAAFQLLLMDTSDTDETTADATPDEGEMDEDDGAPMVTEEAADDDTGDNGDMTTATDAASPTPTATITSPPQAASPTASATITSQPQAATATPTNTGFPSPTATTPAASATNTPTIASTPSPTLPAQTTVAPTPTAVIDVEEAPEIYLTISGIDYYPAGVRFSYQDANDNTITVSRPVSQEAETVRASQLSDILLVIGEPIPNTVIYSVRDRSTFEELSTEEREGSNLILFTLENTPPGLYWLSVEILWGDTSAEYFFSLEMR